MLGFKVVGLMCAALACSAYAEEAIAPAQYEFAYAVNDPTTGDQKDQQEARNGDDVTGYYRTVDADGYLRTVNYKADAVNGFTAEVVRTPVNGAAAVPAVVPAPVVVQKAVVPVVAAPVVPAPVTAAPAVVPYTNPASLYYSSAAAYPYGYQSYPYSGYSPYSSYSQYPFSNGAYPYSYGAYPYSNGAYPYSNGAYPYSYNRYPYNGQYALRK